MAIAYRKVLWISEVKTPVERKGFGGTESASMCSKNISSIKEGKPQLGWILSTFKSRVSEPLQTAFNLEKQCCKDACMYSPLCTLGTFWILCLARHCWTRCSLRILFSFHLIMMVSNPKRRRDCILPEAVSVLQILKQVTSKLLVLSPWWMLYRKRFRGIGQLELTSLQKGYSKTLVQRYLIP